MSWPQVVFFDLDDTLVDHRAAATAAVTSWLAGLSAPIGAAATGISADAHSDADAVRLWFELEDKHFPAARRGETTMQEHRRRRAREFLAALDIPVDDDPAALDAAFDGYLREFERAWVAFADARAVLLHLRGVGVRTAVITNGPQEQQEAKVVATGIVDVCGPVLAFAFPGPAKPDPEAYRYACARMDVDPGDAVMVGDNYSLDVVGARASGLTGVHLDRYGTHPPGESCRIASLAELPVVLTGLAAARTVRPRKTSTD